jgi:DNA-binding NtrC family response regulator
MAPRVLIIEPSLDLRRSFTGALERRKIAVRTAVSALEALDLCAEFAPDIVIAAYVVGDEPASDAVRELKRRHPRAVVLLTTDAFATEQTLGTLRLLPRPSEPRALLDLLRRAVSADSLWYVRRSSAAG